VAIAELLERIEDRRFDGAMAVGRHVTVREVVRETFVGRPYLRETR